MLEVAAQEAGELFSEPAGDGDDQGRAARTVRRRRAKDAPPAPGSFEACAQGRCRDCPGGPIYVQAPWATAGLEPPSPFDAPGHWETCAHACHAPKTSGGSS